MKKLLLFIMSAMVAIAASADFVYGDFTFNVQSDGTATIFGFKSGYTGNPTSITIPGYVFDSSVQKYFQVKTIGPSAFHDKTSLQRVTIEYGVENIHQSAFNGCTSLNIVDLPSSIKRIDNYAFYKAPITMINCAAETMPTISSNAFYGLAAVSGSRYWTCATPDGMTAANAVSLITSNFTTQWSHTAADFHNHVMGRNSDGNLYDVYMNVTQGWDPATQSYGRVKLLGANARASATNKTLKIGYNESYVQGLGHYYVTRIDKSMRYRCSTIETLDMSETNKIDTISDYAFFGCTSLTKAILSAKIIGLNAFAGCSNLKTLRLYGSNETSQGVQKLGVTCFTRTAVQNVYIPASLTTYGYGAFAFCGSLTQFTVSSSNSYFATHSSTPNCLYSKDKTLLHQLGAGTTSMSGPLGDCMPNALTAIANYAMAGSKLTTVDIPYGVTFIGTNVFNSMPNVTTIRIPSSVAMIQTATFDGLSTTTLKHLHFNLKTVPASLQYATVFSSLPSGVTLHVPLWRTGHYQNASWWSPSNGWKTKFTGGVVEDAYDFDFIKYASGSTTYVDYTLRYTVSSTQSYTDTYVQSSPVNGQLTVVGSVIGADDFNGTVNFPKTVSHRGKTYMITEVQREVFRNKSTIKKVTGGDAIRIIGAKAFAGLSRCTSFEIPRPVEFCDSALYGCATPIYYLGDRLTRIGKSALVGTGLEDVAIPNTVTEIDDHAFDGVGLRSLALGNGLKRIGAYAFHRNLLGGVRYSLPTCLEEIGDCAFYGWTGLQLIINRTEKTKIGNEIFAMYDSSKDVIYAPLNQYRDIENQTRSWLSNPENNRHLLPCYRPTTRFSLISIPMDANLQIPDYCVCYYVDGYDRTDKQFTFTALKSDRSIPSNTGIMFCGDPGDLYLFNQPPANIMVNTPVVNYLVAPQGDSQFFATSQGSGAVYTLDGTAKKFYLRDLTVYSGGAALRIPQSLFGTTPPSSVDLGSALINVASLQMWINDVEVTPDNAGDLSVIDGVSGQLSFDYKTNTLKMKNATITTTDQNCIDVYSDGVTIDLQGVNRLNRGEGTAASYGNSGILVFSNGSSINSLTIRNTGTLNVSHPTGICIRQQSGSLTIADGAQINLTGQDGLIGSQYHGVALEMHGAKTKLTANCTEDALNSFNEMHLYDGLAITEPVGAYLSVDTVFNGTSSIILSWLKDANGNAVKNLVISKPTTPQYRVGDVNHDGFVDVDDLNIIINIMVGKNGATLALYPDADVDKSGGVDVDDLNIVINVMLGKATQASVPKLVPKG